VLKPGDRFKHYKQGTYYNIVSLFTWEPTHEEAVLYENETTGERWGRPVSVFLEEVTGVPRFTKVSDGPTPSPMYYMDENRDENGQPYWDVKIFDGTGLLTLKGGNAPLILLTYLNMQSHGQRRADDYMAGVSAGCVHMHLVGPK
jgi:hypothetical protein